MAPSSDTVPATTPRYTTVGLERPDVAPAD